MIMNFFRAVITIVFCSVLSASPLFAGPTTGMNATEVIPEDSFSIGSVNPVPQCKRMTIDYNQQWIIAPGKNCSATLGNNWVAIGIQIGAVGQVKYTPNDPYIYDWENPNFSHPFSSLVCKAGDCNNMDPGYNPVPYYSTPDNMNTICAPRVISFSTGPCTQ